MRRVTRLMLSIGLLGGTIHAQAPAGSNPDPTRVLRSLRPIGRLAGRPDTAFSITDRLRYWNVPGASVAIIDDFRIVHAAGFGVAEFGGSEPIDTNTLFLAGSISKPVFTIGALRLVEQGRLSLDEDVNVRLRSWRVPESKFTKTEKVTLRRLLTHTAGLTVWGFPGYAAGEPLPTVPQILDGARPANTPAVRNDAIPGARWMYSGGGFTVAQLLATDVSSDPFPALMKRLVLDPADMPHSTFENPLPAAFAATAAAGHERINTPVTGRYHSYPEMAAAGLWTTAPDLARWAIALSRAYHGEEGGALSPNSARQMLSKQVTIPPSFGGGHVGLGVEVSGEGDSLSFSHSGKDEGFLATVKMWPRLGRGYVVLTNGVSGALLSEIDRAFAECFGLTGLPRVERQAVSVTSAVLEGLAGQYVYKQSRPPSSPPRGLVSIAKSDDITLDISARDTVLWLNNAFNGRSYRLWPLGDDTFFDVNSGTTLVFEREGRSATARARSVRLGNDAKSPVAKRK